MKRMMISVILALALTPAAGFSQGVTAMGGDMAKSGPSGYRASDQTEAAGGQVDHTKMDHGKAANSGNLSPGTAPAKPPKSWTQDSTKPLHQGMPAQKGSGDHDHSDHGGHMH